MGLNATWLCFRRDSPEVTLTGHHRSDSGGFSNPVAVHGSNIRPSPAPKPANRPVSARAFNAYDFIPEPLPGTPTAAGGVHDEDYLEPSPFLDYWPDDQYERVKIISDDDDDCAGVNYVNSRY